MNAAAFVSLVELRTKAASLLPFLFGLAYARRNFGAFDAINSLLMLASLLCVDMGTTALNNYADWKRARRREGYNYETHNAVAAFRLRERTVKAVLAVLFGAAAAFGLALAGRTGLGTLVLGAGGFAVGIAYSAGPLPISRTPFGELVSGAAMGLLIPLLAVHVNAPDTGLFGLAIDWPRTSLSLDLSGILPLALASMPLAFGIADIMLANNLCDLEEDRAEGRLTLPIAIGRERALTLFTALALLFPVPVVLSAALGALPLPSLLVLAALVPVSRSTAAFRRSQSKKDTFVLAVRNFFVVAVLLAATTAVWIPLSS